MIGILDYGMGNLKSVANTLDFIGARWTIVQDIKGFRNVAGLIIPGVGTFSKAMENIRKNQFDQEIYRGVEAGKPILGICLGMQILLASGSEGEACQGLGIITGQVDKITGAVKIPHMGWNSVNLKASPLTQGIPQMAQFYFVHSYRASQVKDENVLGTTMYSKEFPSAVFQDRIFGVQFHPEKSGKWGIRLLENFRELVECC